MILSDFIVETHYAYKGNSRPPEAGTDKYLKYVSIASRKIRGLAQDSNVDWVQFFDSDFTLVDTIQANVQTYNATNVAGDKLHKASDFIYVRKTNGELVKFQIVQPNERDLHTRAVYISGNNPKTLTFYDTMATDSEYIGASIIVPCYIVPADLDAEDPDDVIPLEYPDWAVLATAAELARNDPAKDDQFANLTGLANEQYLNMKANNDEAPYRQPNTVISLISGPSEVSE